MAETMKRVTVTIPEHDHRILQKLGCGNASLGVRVLIDAYSQDLIADAMADELPFVEEDDEQTS